MTQNTIQASTPVTIVVPAQMVQNIAVMLASHPYKDVAEILNMLQASLNAAAAKAAESNAVEKTENTKSPPAKKPK